MARVLAIVLTLAVCAQGIDWLGYFNTPGEAVDIEVAGGYAWVADGDSGVAVIDVADPASPSLVTTVPTAGPASDIVLNVGYAYVAAGDSGLLVVDIDPVASAHVVNTLDTLGTVLTLEKSGDLLFVAGDDLGVFIMSIAAPIVPIWRSRFVTTYHVSAMGAAGDTLFAAEYINGVHIIDVTDPTLPSEINNYPRPGIRGIAVHDTLVYITDDNIYSFSMSSLTDLVPVENYCCFTGNQVVPVGDRLYLPNTRFGLRILDAADPADLSTLGIYVAPDDVNAVALVGDTAYLADGLSGLQILDVTDPSGPVVLDSYGGRPYIYYAVELIGDYAYVADWYNFPTIDVSTPANLRFSAFAPVAGNHYDVAVSGGFAYVASDGAGLQVIDARAPDSPDSVGEWDSPGRARGVAVSDTLVCLVDYDSGLHVLSVSNPASPAWLGSVPTPGMSWKVAIAGSHAYAADGTEGVQIADISDPSTPTLLTPYDTPGEARHVTVVGDHAYVADGWEGVHVLDVSSPSAVTLLDTYDTPGFASMVLVRDDKAYIADGFSRIPVLDITTPSDLQLLTTYETEGKSVDLAAVGTYGPTLYSADGEGGLCAIDVQGSTGRIVQRESTPREAASVVMLRALGTQSPRVRVSVPNAVLQSMHAGDAITLRIMDACGRVVADLSLRVNRYAAPQMLPLPADLPVGLYCVRFDIGEFSAVSQGLIVR